MKAPTRLSTSWLSPSAHRDIPPNGVQQILGPLPGSLADPRSPVLSADGIFHLRCSDAIIRIRPSAP